MEYIQNTILLCRLSTMDRGAAVKMLRNWFCRNPSGSCCHGLLMGFLKFKRIRPTGEHQACTITNSIYNLIARHPILSANISPVIEYSRSFDIRLIYPRDERAIGNTLPTRLLNAVRWMTLHNTSANFVYAHGTSAITSIDIEPIFVFSDVVCCTMPASYTFEYDLEIQSSLSGASRYNRICFLTYVPDPGPVGMLMTKIPVQYKYTLMPVFMSLRIDSLDPVSVANDLPNPHLQEHDTISSRYVSVSTLYCKDTAVFFKMVNLSKPIYNRTYPTCVIFRESYGKLYTVRTPDQAPIHDTVYELHAGEFRKNLNVIEFIRGSSRAPYTCTTTCTIDNSARFTIVWKHPCRLYHNAYRPMPINIVPFGDFMASVIPIGKNYCTKVQNVKLSTYIYTKVGPGGIIEVYHKNLLQPVGYVPTETTVYETVYDNANVPLSVKLLLAARCTNNSIPTDR